METEMKLREQIRKYRTEMKLSQEELAARIYVSRQTVSNWETGKNYPDIHSLLLLSALFGVSLDQLIKGDIETMKREVNQSEVTKMNLYGWIHAALLAAIVLSTVPLALWLGWLVFIPFGILFACDMYVAVKLEQMKREHNIHTYKEILAFMEGKTLDEIEQQVEKGKRPYQKVMLVLGSGAIAVLVCLLMGLLLSGGRLDFFV